tara:strand:- start:2509 stop:3090 length:582 start_codon:yes stop_codon:yes gene_type:complete
MNKLIILLFPVLVLGNFDYVSNGFGLDIGSSGSGIFIMRNYGHSSERYSLNGELRYYDIKGDDETIVEDYYTGQYKTLGGKSLFMLPAFIGANYYPFVGKIENNFSPFITVKGGMLTTVDGREFGSFSERWKNSEIQFSPGGFLGVGIDFKMVGQSTVMVMVGFELLPLKKIADGKNNYSGFLIHLSFNRRAK